MSPTLVQVKREFWEHRGLAITPLALGAALLLIVALFGFAHAGHTRIEWQGGPTILPGFLIITLGWGGPFWIALAILTSVYLVDCLYGERRDRSILFWRSLPVSDTRTVLTKFAVGWVVVPLGTFAIVALTNLVANGLVAARATLLPPPFVYHFSTARWLYLQGLQLYILLAALLWYAPYAAYLLLVSAWARRSVWAWALIPPLVVAISEYTMFGTSYVASVLLRRFADLLHLAFSESAARVAFASDEPVIQAVSPLRLLSSLQVWWGLAFAAVCIALAIRVRRWRDEA